MARRPTGGTARDSQRCRGRGIPGMDGRGRHGVSIALRPACILRLWLLWTRATRVRIPGTGRICRAIYRCTRAVGTKYEAIQKHLQNFPDGSCREGWLLPHPDCQYRNTEAFSIPGQPQPDCQSPGKPSLGTLLRRTPVTGAPEFGLRGTRKTGIRPQATPGRYASRLFRQRRLIGSRRSAGQWWSAVFSPGLRTIRFFARTALAFFSPNTPSLLECIGMTVPAFMASAHFDASSGPIL